MFLITTTVLWFTVAIMFFILYNSYVGGGCRMEQSIRQLRHRRRSQSVLTERLNVGKSRVTLASGPATAALDNFVLVSGKPIGVLSAFPR